MDMDICILSFLLTGSHTIGVADCQPTLNVLQMASILDAASHNFISPYVPVTGLNSLPYAPPFNISLVLGRGGQSLDSTCFVAE